MNSMEAPSVYRITYTGPIDELPIELDAPTAREALVISGRLAANGHAPTIERDGVHYSHHEFELAVEGSMFRES